MQLHSQRSRFEPCAFLFLWSNIGFCVDCEQIGKLNFKTYKTCLRKCKNGWLFASNKQLSVRFSWLAKFSLWCFSVVKRWSVFFHMLAAFLDTSFSQFFQHPYFKRDVVSHMPSIEIFLFVPLWHRQFLLSLILCFSNEYWISKSTCSAIDSYLIPKNDRTFAPNLLIVINMYYRAGKMDI